MSKIMKGGMTPEQVEDWVENSMHYGMTHEQIKNFVINSNVTDPEAATAKEASFISFSLIFKFVSIFTCLGSSKYLNKSKKPILAMNVYTINFINGGGNCKIHFMDDNIQ